MAVEETVEETVEEAEVVINKTEVPFSAIIV